MKKPPLLILLTAFALNTYAQQNPVVEKYAGFISADDAKKHLSILASDAFEGRETGKPGAEKAANYIAAQFKLLGLEAPVNGSYLLNVPLVQNSMKLNTFTVNGKAFDYAKDFGAVIYQPFKNIDANNIVFVGYGTEAEIGNTDLSGKAVLWINEDKPIAGKTTNTGYNLNAKRRETIKYLESKKVAVILAANPAITEALRLYGSAMSTTTIGLKEDNVNSDEVRLFHITPRLADELVKQSGKTYEQLRAISAAATVPASIIKSRVIINHTDTRKDINSADVLGYIPGTDLKDEVVVFSAHYDHIGLSLDPNAKDKVFNGADDDGSGTTGIIEIARAFAQAKKDGHGPRRSILILANVGEEKGLLGSQYYTDHPVFPLANTVTNLNIDMIGRVDYEYTGKPDSANYIYVIGSAKLSTELHDINEQANKSYSKLILDYKYDDPNDPKSLYTRSDHYNFAKHGVPIIFYTSGEHKDYHQPSDEISKIDFPMLVKRAKLVFYTGWELANRDKRPVVDTKTSK